jgi:hypothetical protein
MSSSLPTRHATLWLWLLALGTLSAQTNGSAWRTYFGLTYNTADSEAATRGIGPGYGLVGVANLGFGEGPVQPALSLGGAASYGGDDETGESGFLMVRPFVGLGANYNAINTRDLTLSPRLLVGAEAIGLYVDETENGEGSVNAFINPGIALQTGDLSFMLDYRFSVANLSTIVDDDSDYLIDGRNIEEPSDLAPGTLTFGVAYKAVALHLSLWNRAATFDDTGGDAEDKYEASGLTIGLGVAIGN